MESIIRCSVCPPSGTSEIPFLLIYCQGSKAPRCQQGKADLDTVNRALMTIFCTKMREPYQIFVFNSCAHFYGEYQINQDAFRYPLQFCYKEIRLHINQGTFGNLTRKSNGWFRENCDYYVDVGVTFKNMESYGNVHNNFNARV